MQTITVSSAPSIDWQARATAAEAREVKLREVLRWIAEMTDVEADFDGFAARTKARQALQETTDVG
jgi:hypothetical protein